LHTGQLLISLAHQTTMASLTQARLVPLTHRYLAMSTWRPECLTLLDVNTAAPRNNASLNEATISKQKRIIKTRDDCVMSRHHYHMNDVLQKEINTPERLAGDKHLRLDKQLVDTNLFTIMYNDIVVLNCYRENSTLRKIITFKKWFKPQHKTTTKTGCDISIGNHNNNNNNNNKGNSSNRGSSFLPFYVMFGFLGVFHKPTANELEEERERLSDEQKIKKMKPVELAIAKGVLSMCDQNYERANQLFHEALHIAQDENDEEREELILNLIASNYFESGDLQNAEKLFIDLMKRMIAHDVSPTAPAILELSLKLASIYSKNPQTSDKALKGFKFVISSLLNDLDDIINDIEKLDLQDISEEKKNELALLGWSYDWFAKHLLIMNDYSAAAAMLLKAYEISTKVLGPLHDQTLILLNDIGTTLAMNNSPDEGKKFIEKAVEGAITNHSSELASFYVNLGLVYLKLNDLKEAKQYCEYSMDLAKKNREQYNSHEIVELSQTCLTHIQKFLGTKR
jgi:tetratricopeptide repeat protein 19